MKIKRVEIEAFRAYRFKKDSTFDFSIKQGVSNFISIYSPNGFGKSSFYDAVEWAVTHSIKRYNHKVNEEAARVTKGDEAQYIIRNKDVPDSVDTSVKVVTNNIHQIYSNNFKFSSVRKNSRDYRFNEGGENIFFRRVILAQDSIDRFLKEIKPEERYRSFMEYWDEDLENSRIKITSLLNQNTYKISELKKEYNNKERSLEQELSDSFVIDEFNKIVDELNQHGEVISFISDSYDERSEYELISLVKRRIYEVGQEHDNSLTTKDGLNRKILEIPDIEKKIDLINQDSNVITHLTNYLDLLDNKNILLNRLLEKKLEYHELEKLNGFVKVFEREKPSFIAQNKAKDNWLKKQGILKEQKEGTEKLIEQYKDKIKNANEKIADLSQSMKESQIIYERLTSLEEEVKAVTKIIHEKKEYNKEDIEKKQKLISQIDVISKLRLDIDSLITQDISFLALDREKIDKIKQLHESLSVIELQSGAIVRGQKIIGQQKEIIEELISLGLNYVSKWSSEICPLCQASYASTEELYEAISKNTNISDLDRQNSYLLSEWETQKEKIEGQLKEELEVVVQIKSDKLSILRNKLVQLNEKIDSSEKTQRESERQQAELLEEIKKLSLEINELSQDELVKDINAKEKSLKAEVITAESNLELSKMSLQQNNIFLLECEKELFTINEYFKNLEKEDYFIQISSFLEKHRAHYTELTNLSKSEWDKLSEKKDGIEEQISEIKQKIQSVTQSLVSNNALIDLNNAEEIKKEKENIVRQLKNEVDVFYSSVEKLINDNYTERSKILEKIKTSFDDISLELIGQKNKLSKFEILLNQIQLAKGYFTRRSMEKEIQELNARIDNHEQVSEKLSNMLDSILSSLRKKVDGFFYTDLINMIYKKIDPHPSFKRVEFMLDTTKTQPSLNITLRNEGGEIISPNLYFSSAQLNVLSLSVFLANALHAKDDENNPIDVILIDDPIQAMDSINILSTIDLLRNISVNFDKQIIISTHNENFFRLLQKKIPTNVFDSKFFTLNSIGIVKPYL